MYLQLKETIQEKLKVNGYSFPATFGELMNQVPLFAVERRFTRGSKD